ncbi:MAG: class I SAM-dependent methyltransferase, partial [Myxococcota bacterium]
MTRDFSKTIAYYQDYLQNDDVARKAGWSSQADQELRFEHLLEALDPTLEQFSLLDVGCGTGALYAYLKRTGRQVDYLGLDIVPAMVDEARRLHPEGSFERADLLAEPPERMFDVVFCCGVLTHLMEDHATYTHAMLAQMVALAHQVVVVNVMSSRNFVLRPALRHDTEYHYYDPVELYRMGRALTPWVVLREDIRMTDVTLYM